MPCGFCGNPVITKVAEEKDIALRTHILTCTGTVAHTNASNSISNLTCSQNGPEQVAVQYAVQWWLQDHTEKIMVNATADVQAV